MAAAENVWRDPKAAAAYAGVSQQTLLRAARRGDLQGHKVGGRKLWRFRTEALDLWIIRSSTPVPFVAPRRGAA